MNKLIKYIIILQSALLFFTSKAQNNMQSICRIDNGEIIFQINLKWNQEKRKEICNQYDIDSLVIVKVFEGQTDFTVKNEFWKVKRISSQIVEISKELDRKPLSNINKNNVLLSLDNDIRSKPYKDPEFSNYGVNDFDLTSIFKYSNGIAIFHLPKYANAQKVYLSGTFNDWSTQQTPMQKSDSGWVVKIKLKPGMYYYKYIIDGRWIDDPNNNKKIRDGNWGYNSIIFCYNFQFKLNGNADARRVFVAGSFNNWNPTELKLIKAQKGWVLPMYLREGTHTYKFILDGTWITDPGNNNLRPDGRGNINSYVGIGEEHLFKLEGYPFAKKVFLIGNFNAWNQNEIEMDKVDGGWQVRYALASGNYEYKFVVDGKFITDPTNPYKVGWGDYTNSFLAFKANHVFILKSNLDAYNVYVAGNFNFWDKTKYRMEKRNGRWEFPIYLKPGKYTYKFIVNSDWIIDPGNKLWEENEYGTKNSVLWIEQ